MSTSRRQDRLVEEALKELELAVAVVALDKATKNLPRPRRPLTPAEIAAGTDFDAIEQRNEDTSRELLAATTPLADFLIVALPAYLLGAKTVSEVRQRLQDLRSPITGTTLPGFDEVYRETVSDLKRILERVWKPAAEGVLGEASKQGVVKLPDAVGITSSARKTIDSGANAIATYRTQRLYTVAVSSKPAPTVSQWVENISSSIVGVNPAGTLNVARQSVQQVEGMARAEQISAEDMPQYGFIVASEVLDRSTCDACQSVDGKEYATMEEAYQDYPDGYGYVNCEGGPNCRGVIVASFLQEAA